MTRLQLIIASTFLIMVTSWQNNLDSLTGSLNNFIGFEDGSYFIEVPEGQIDEFFQWNPDYPQLVSAHRGGFITGFPENAIATFEKTLTTAPALLEVDLRRTADGEWILMHDEDLTRTTNGTGIVEETTLAEIQTLQLEDNQGNLTPYPVPTLEEALIWAEGRTILELDLKSDDYTSEVVEIITELDAEDQVRFITDSVEQATEIYNLNPEIHLGLFIIPDNQETVFADIAAAPFTLDKISAFTGTQPQSAQFYADLHEQGIVAIQGLFGEQDTFDGTLIDDLDDEQRESLFETVFSNGGDVIAADYYQQIAAIIGYPEEDESEIEIPEPIFGSLSADILELSSSNNLVFAGAGNDLIDASLADGNNRIYGDSGDDTFILGTNDRLGGAEGSDRFFVGNGGDNKITGGADTDRFWIAKAEIPESANIITDFTSGEDVIGVAGLGIGFDELTITAIESDALISGLDSDLAILRGVDAASLNADDFAFA